MRKPLWSPGPATSAPRLDSRRPLGRNPLSVASWPAQPRGARLDLARANSALMVLRVLNGRPTALGTRVVSVGTYYHASSTTRPNGSLRDGMQTTSAALYLRGHRMGTPSRYCGAITRGTLKTHVTPLRGAPPTPSTWRTRSAADGCIAKTNARDATLAVALPKQAAVGRDVRIRIRIAARAPAHRRPTARGVRSGTARRRSVPTDAVSTRYIRRHGFLRGICIGGCIGGSKAHSGMHSSAFFAPRNSTACRT